MRSVRIGGVGRSVPLCFDGFGVRHRNDCGDTPAAAGHVGDAAPDGGFVEDVGQGGPQFADADLGACVRRHAPMVADALTRTQVYTWGYKVIARNPP